MGSLIVVIAVGLAGGVAAGLQGPLASVMGRSVGVMGSVFVIHLGGTLAAACLLAVPGAADLSAWRSVPWYALTAGWLGLLLVGAFVYCVPRIGAAATMTLIICVQLTAGLLLDHFGLLVEHSRSLNPSRLLGVAALLIGTWLVVRQG